MTYKSVEHGYVFWQEALLLPMKKRQPGEKQKYFRKVIGFEEADTYWEYLCEDGIWSVYYVKRGKNRRLAQCNVGKFSPESIIARIKDRDISVVDCRNVEEGVYARERTVNTTVYWSVDYDGKSVFDLMEDKEKMPYAHIKMVIANEGGYIDNDGIIHRGARH